MRETARAYALNVIGGLAPLLETEFLVLADYIIEHPDSVSRPPKGLTIADEAYWSKIAERFVDGRKVRQLAKPNTVPDPMVSLILQIFYGIESERLDQIKREHALSMVAENSVGDLLERYISEEIGGAGWVWISGSLIRSVDFIRRAESGGFDELQIKNRDNSENSSSSSVRKDTNIKKWYRTKSKTGETMWEEFPLDSDDLKPLSEQGFREFVLRYLPSVMQD